MDKWPIEKMSLKDLRPAEYNPRTITDEARGGLGESLNRFGYVEPIVWNKRTGNVVGGHQRLSILEDKGEEEVEVVVVDIDESEEVALNLTLNNPLIEGDWTDELANVLSGVNEDVREALRFDVLEEFADMGKQGEQSSNKEIDVGALLGDSEECPNCGFEWEATGDDFIDLEEE